jgi:hypothetical protein
MWRNVFGLSESEALVAVGQDFVELSESDRLAASLGNIFRPDEGAAQIAAEGRRVSGFGRGPADETGGFDAHLRLAQEALDRMSDEECDRLLEEQRQRRTRAKTTPVKEVGSCEVG